MKLEIAFHVAQLDPVGIIYISAALQESARLIPAIRFLTEPLIGGLVDEWARRRCAELGRAVPAAAVSLSLELTASQASLAAKALEACATHIRAAGDGQAWYSSAAEFVGAMAAAFSAAIRPSESSHPAGPVN